MSSKSMIITVVVVLVIGAGGFYGGTVYEKGSLSKQGLLRSSASAQGANGAQRGPGGAGFARGGAGGNNSGNFVAGQITAKNDSSITVQGRDGSSKIVFFSGSTSIGKAAQGTASDLTNGEQVVVTGTASSDGTVAAQNIQIRPADQQTPQPGQ